MSSFGSKLRSYASSKKGKKVVQRAHAKRVLSRFKERVNRPSTTQRIKAWAASAQKKSGGRKGIGKKLKGWERQVRSMERKYGPKKRSRKPTSLFE